LNGLLWSYQSKFSFSQCTESVRILTAKVKEVMKWHLGPPASKMSNSRMSKKGQIVNILDTFTTIKTWTGPHKTFHWAGCGSRIGHSCFITTVAVFLYYTLKCKLGCEATTKTNTVKRGIVEYLLWHDNDIRELKEVVTCFTATFCIKDCCDQERNEVKWRPTQAASLAPIFEPEVFRKQMYCDEESDCDIVGTFWRPS